MNARNAVATVSKPCGREYDFLRRHQLDSFHSQLPSFVEAVWWPRTRLRAVRQQRLRALVALAKARSPWHARRLAHVDPEQLTEDTLRDIPSMTKADLMANFDEIVTDRTVRRADVEAHIATMTGDAYFGETSHAVMSGGSSGMRGLFAYDWAGWIDFGLSSARPIVLALRNLPPAVRQRAVAFAGNYAAHGSAAFTQSFAPWLLAQFESFVPIPMSLSTEAIVERLNAIQPTCLSGFPSVLNQLCFAARAGSLRIRPVALLVGGETVSPEQRRTLEETFGAKVFDFYGACEASCVGFSCPAGDGLHLCDDITICEPVDRASRATIPGETSEKLLLTNLFNDLLPLIRYELDDCVVTAEHGRRCPCGSAFTKVPAVNGRFFDTFTYGGGVTIHPLLFASVLCVDGVVEYQVRQTSDGAEVSVHGTDGLDVEELAIALTRQLAQHGLREARVSVTRVEKIERTDAGKVRRFIPLAAAIG